MWNPVREMGLKLILKNLDTQSRMDKQGKEVDANILRGIA